MIDIRAMRFWHGAWPRLLTNRHAEYLVFLSQPQDLMISTSLPNKSVSIIKMPSAMAYLNPYLILMKFYPRANENRTSASDPAVRVPRRKFLKAAGINFLLLQILFLGLFSYLFGSLFRQTTHVNHLNILFVDYDGGIVGNSVRDAYGTLEGVGFPTLNEMPVNDFPTPRNLEQQVCQLHYWAALYVSPGASSRLQNALSGKDSTYNKSDVLGYIWNEVRYPAIADSLIEGNIQTLLATAREVFVSNETEALQTLSANSSASISIFADPWQPVSFNIMPTVQGSRLIYNTLVIILILLQEFFYLGTINGLSVAFNFYLRFRPRRIIIYRLGISLLYTFVGSLSTAGAIWAFRDGWKVNANQFALTWAILWLFAHVNFLIFDVFTVWLPLPFVPMSLVTWVVFNVTSILIPFELMPGFYHWSYAVPANEAFRTLLDIWSGGCEPQLHIALPVLFSLEVVSFLLSSLGVYRRCHNAVVADEVQQKAFREKLDAALSLEREQDKEAQTEPLIAAEDTLDTNLDQASTQVAEERRERKLSSALRREDTNFRQIQTRTNQSIQFGPCFGVPFSSSED